MINFDLWQVHWLARGLFAVYLSTKKQILVYYVH